MRQTAVQFLVDLCRPSQLSAGPFLRGFYFTGVRPVIINEAAPVAAAAQQQQGPGGYGSASGATGIFNVGARAAAQPQYAAPAPVARLAQSAAVGLPEPLLQRRICWPTVPPWAPADPAPRPASRGVCC